MERFEVEQDRTLAALVDAVERGEPVEIVRGGRTVADVVRREPEVRPLQSAHVAGGEIDRRWSRLSKAERDAAELVRTMRDDDD